MLNQKVTKRKTKIVFNSNYIIETAVRISDLITCVHFVLFIECIQLSFFMQNYIREIYF